MRILLIEDNDDDAELIALELADAGIAHVLHRIELRAELESALQADDWSLVICDSRLPGYSGAEAFEQICARLPRVPFLFCVGHAQIEDAALAAAIERSHGWISKERLSALPDAVRAATAAAPGNDAG